MMASVDAEAEMENLFADDEAVEGGTQSLTQQEGTGLSSQYPLVLIRELAVRHGVSDAKPGLAFIPNNFTH